MLLFLTELALESTLFALRKTYDLGYYMIYGEEETKEDIILKEIQELKKQNIELKQELDSIRDSENN